MQPRGPVVRAVTPADVAAVTRLQVASWRAAYAGIIPAGYLAAMSAAEGEQRHLARVLDPEPRAAYLLSEQDGAVVGMTNVGPSRDADLDPTVVAEIRAMYVDPPAWSSGVGAALMSAALDHLIGHGARAVALWVLEGNARARAFYERWQFCPDGAQQIVELGRPVSELRYYRQLANYRQLDRARSPGPDFWRT